MGNVPAEHNKAFAHNGLMKGRVVMGARRTKNEFMDEEWEFDTYDEMASAAQKEARVCGDTLKEAEDSRSFEILNYHQNSVRWKGYLTPQAKWVSTHCAVKRRFTVVLTNEELSILKDGDRDVRKFVIEQILEQASELSVPVTKKAKGEERLIKSTVGIPEGRSIYVNTDVLNAISSYDAKGIVKVTANGFELLLDD